MSKILKYFIVVFLWVLTRVTLASGPSLNMGHLNIALHGKMIGFDMKLPLRFLSDFDIFNRGEKVNFGILEDKALSGKIIEKILQRQQLKINNHSLEEENCSTTDKKVTLGFGTFRFIEVIKCLRAISSFSMDLKYLKNEKQDFLVAGTLGLQKPPPISFQITKESTLYSFEVGETCKNWTFSLEIGVLLLLLFAFILYITISRHKGFNR